MTMPNRSRDWLRQAIHDLEPAEESRQAGRHDWACFAAYSQKPFLYRATDFDTSRLPVPADLPSTRKTNGRRWNGRGDARGCGQKCDGFTSEVSQDEQAYRQCFGHSGCRR